MDLSTAHCTHNQDVLEQVFSQLPTDSILDKLSTMFAGSGRSNSQQMEGDTAILTFFRTLSGEGNCDDDSMTDEDTELNMDLTLTGDPRYADVLTHHEESPSHLILPVEGNIIMCKAVIVNTGQETMIEGGVESVQPENNGNHLHLSEEFVKGGESEQTAPLNRHSRTHINLDKEAAEATDGPEQSWSEGGELNCEELSGHMNIHHEDRPEEHRLAPLQSPQVLNGLANTHLHYTHNVDDAQGDIRGETKGRDLRSNEDGLTLLYTRTEQATFELQPHTATSSSGPSDAMDPNLTRMESAYEEEVTPAATASEMSKDRTDSHPNVTHEGHHNVRTSEAVEEEADSDDNDAAADLTSELCEGTSPNSMEAPPVASSMPAFTIGGPLPRTNGTDTRTTFAPSSPTDKPIQMPALFSGLRVFRKGVMGPEHDTVSQIKSPLQRSKKELVPGVENSPGDAAVQKRERILHQISQFLNQGENLVNQREEKTWEEAHESDVFSGESRQVFEEEMEGNREDFHHVADQPPELTELQDAPKSPVSGAEAAFDAFKSFFTPKPLRIDPSERFDLDTVRKRIRSDKDVLRALFERSAGKTPAKDSPSDGKVGICVSLTQKTHY